MNCESQLNGAMKQTLTENGDFDYGSVVILTPSWERLMKTTVLMVEKWGWLHADVHSQ